MSIITKPSTTNVPRRHKKSNPDSYFSPPSRAGFLASPPGLQEKINCPRQTPTSAHQVRKTQLDTHTTILLKQLDHEVVSHNPMSWRFNLD